MLSVGTKVKLSNLFKEPRANAKVIAILPAGRPPDKNLIYLYYGLNAPKSVFKALKLDRIIIQKTDKTYVIIPDHPRQFEYYTVSN